MTTHPKTFSLHERQQIYRRTLTVVVIGQTFGGAGLAAGLTVGVLIAEEMLGTEALSGLAVGVLTLGAALTAHLVGQVTQKFGRRLALGFGFGTGGVGALGVIAATVIDSPVLFFFSLFLYGAGTATNLQARYAGTDLAPKERKATAVSIAMVATTLGAVAGPNLVEPLGHLATHLGLDPLASPFLLAAAAYLAAGIFLACHAAPGSLPVSSRDRACRCLLFPIQPHPRISFCGQSPSSYFRRTGHDHLTDCDGSDYDHDTDSHASHHGRGRAYHRIAHCRHVATVFGHRHVGG